jgi:hypothetical protein
MSHQALLDNVDWRRRISLPRIDANFRAHRQKLRTLKRLPIPNRPPRSHPSGEPCIQPTPFHKPGWVMEASVVSRKYLYTDESAIEGQRKAGRRRESP